MKLRSIQKAKQLILAEKFEETKEILSPLGHDNNPEAQLLLGYLYYGGDDNTTAEQAEYWLAKSSANGNPAAMYYIATTNFQDEYTSYLPGNERLLALLEKAAQRGSAEAQRNLAILYANGEIVQQSYEKAMYWDEQAALQGLVESQRDLALMLLEGFEDNVPKIDKAIFWYEKAALYDCSVPEAQWAAEELAQIYDGQYDEKYIDPEKKQYWQERANYLEGIKFRLHPDWFYKNL